MLEKITRWINEYQMIEPGDVIVAGVSGGADSVCLLLVLEQIRELGTIPFSIEVVHVDHGIRKEAKRDAEFVSKLCQSKNLPCRIVFRDVRKLAGQAGLSEEEMGRKVRYEAFTEALGTRRGKIAVAHNSNDRAETMLFHLFRGTGLTGACGIRPVQGNIIRPLLCVERPQIEQWLVERQVPFCTDMTNFKDDYTRNRIRHHILAYAQENIVHGAVANMNRAAGQLQQAEDYLAKTTTEAYGRCCQRGRNPDRIEMDLQKLKREDSYIQGRIVLYAICEISGAKKDITEAHVQSVLHLFDTDGSKELSLPYGTLVLKKYQMGIFKKKGIQDTDRQKLPSFEITVPSRVRIPSLKEVEFSVFPYVKSEIIPQKTYTKWFDYDKITTSLLLRTRQKGDYLTVTGQMGRKSLQDYFVDQKIPKQERDSIYVLAEGSHILWVPGMRISEYYKITNETRNVLQVKIHTKENENQNIS